MDELFLERVQPTLVDKVEKNYGLHVLDNPADEANQDYGTYFDFSGFDGLPYTQFRIRFFELAKSMASYGFKGILIPLDDWITKYGESVYTKVNNPIYNMVRLINADYKAMKRELKDTVLIFSRNGSWFAIHVNSYDPKNYTVFLSNIETLCYGMTNTGGEKKAATGIVPPIPPTKVDQDDEENAELKDQLVDAIAQQAEDAESVEDFYDQSDDECIMQIIQDISDDEYGKPKFSSARASRITKVNDEFLNSKTKSGKTLKELIANPESDKELPKTDLSKKVASINSDDWENMQYVNFNKEYDIDEDVRLILQSFANKEYPIVVRSIQAEDNSTSEDYIITYTVGMEDSSGKQFTIKFDMPKFVNNRFMRLRGNDKVISGQLFNLPCTKTDRDTVQVVSNYRKIMISRYGAAGKSYPVSDRLIKTLNKYEGRDVKVSLGDNRRVCDKYELPVDYIDFAMQFNWVETKNYKFYFDQDYYTTNYTVDRTGGKIPLAIRKEDNSIVYSSTDNGMMIADQIAELMLSESPGLLEIYNSQKPATKHTYSRASIMSAHIPMIVVLGNSVPFTDILKKAGIEYTFSEKRVKYDPDKQGCIRFADGFMLYNLTYSSSMLLNGLYDCDTESYNFIDLNKKSTWLDYLDNFGGRIKADGLDNFKEVFMDPITQEVCRECRVPDDYIDLLIYANSLLADNKYIKHTDLSSNRYRTTEIVAGHLYQVLADEYIKYRGQAKRGRKQANFSIKRSAVIDAIFTNPVTSDLSSMSPLLEQEANNSATFKGLSGLNADRAYSLDKRTYDESMIGKLALSTGFSTNVGINRQTTMDMDIQGKRGYIKKTPTDCKSLTKRFSITEATTPFGSTRDDPFRTAMTYIQTSKHSMPTKCGMPLLVTNGADEALAYMVSDNYVVRAERDGIVKEVVPNDHMIVSYSGGAGEGQYISLKEETRKNSDGGFYLTIQMTTDKKAGQKFKTDDILAWDSKTFSNRNGETDHLAYDVGVLAYCAIMATDEGFEDSTAISYWLSEAMGSEVCAIADVELGKMTNVYDMVKVGTPIQEGDPLIIFQNTFDQEDANVLLKNITDQDFVSDLGRIRIKAKYTGVVQDIKIYRTCEVEELSESLQRIVKKHDAEINKLKAVYKKNNIPGANTLEPTEAMPPTGKLKNTNGVRIEFYIKYFDNLGVADKIVAQSANKGVVKAVFERGEEPYSSFDPSKTIHAVFSSRSFNARMVTSPIVSGAINKGLVNLDEQVKKIMGIKPLRLEDIQG